MNLPADQPESDQPSPDHFASTKTHIRRFCRIGRIFCWVLGSALALLALASLVMGIIGFASAPPPVENDLENSSSEYHTWKVGKTLEKLYFELGMAYEWPFPRLIARYQNSEIVTAVCEPCKTRSSHSTTMKSLGIQSFNTLNDLADLTKADDSARSLMKLAYPGLAHALDTNAEPWASKGFVVTDTLINLIWCGLGILLVIRFHHLFSHCSKASVLDRSAIAIYRELLLLYIVILVFGPLSFYLTNLVISGGVAHLLRIPYGGLMMLLILICLYWLAQKTVHLQDEVNATI